MFKVLSGIVLTTSLILVSKVHAQEQFELPVICDKPNLVQNLIKSYNEEPVFVGNDGQHNVTNLKIMITSNDVTKTFSVIMISEEQNRTCVISTGIGFKNYFKF
jgi:hypothetical protein